jgi:hypothetical protein
MKVFHCDHCGHLLFFENSICVQCHRKVAYLPDLALVGSLDQAGDGTWRSPLPAAARRVYRLCRNYTEEEVCNWAVSVDDQNPLCISCRLTRLIPDLTRDGHRQAWYRLEVAKRRVMFTLMQLRLPVVSRDEDPERGLAFEFKADTPSQTGAVFTGHAQGVITINVAEADDVERERMKKAVHEPYRTLLGHVRHEIGHYYWDRLIKDGAIEQFRALFGDERRDYGEALNSHYQNGPPPDWQERYVSPYASAHPWEDWAETWAHYLHMVDALDTAADCGLSLRPARADEPSMTKVSSLVSSGQLGFQQLIDRWLPLTYALNNFNRGLGLPDAYPFVLSAPAISKLQFAHDSGRP